MKPNVLNPPKITIIVTFFCWRQKLEKDAYILYENVKVLPNLVQTFVLLLIFIIQEVKQIIWLMATTAIDKVQIFA